MNKIEYVFLAFEEHPYGRRILQRLVESDFIPKLLIQERSSLATKRRNTYNDALADFTPPPTFEALCSKHSIPQVFVANHNDIESQRAILRTKPDVLILGNTRIIKSKIISMCNGQCLNVHPGLLPLMRGSGPIPWAIVRDQPIGCTVHFVNEGIDEGHIIIKRKMNIKRGTTYSEVVYQAIEQVARLMSEAFALYTTGDLRTVEQNLSLGECYTWPSPQLIELAKRKLQNQTYKYLVD